MISHWRKYSGGGDSGNWGDHKMLKTMTRAKTRIRMSLNGSTPLSLECDQDQHHGQECDQQEMKKRKIFTPLSWAGGSGPGSQTQQALSLPDP